MKKFTWTAIYKEIATKLLNYENKQEDLIRIINKHELGQQFTNPKNRTSSMDGKIDPFTFFSFFNRGLKKENRKKFLEILSKEFKLTSPLPDDFKGIPVTNNQKAWFFDNTEKDNISLLWELFRELVVEGSINGESFNKVLSMKGMGASLITKGLYWVNPQNFICLNNAIIMFLKYKGIEVTKIACFDDYEEIVTKIENSEELRENSDNDEISFLEITLRALERLWLEDIWSFVWPRSSDLLVQKNMIKRKIDSLNTILYGPPGTGKTYKLKNEYLKIFYRSWMIEFASDKNTKWYDTIFLAMLDLSFKGKLSLKSPDKILSKHDFIKGREKNSNNNTVEETIRSHLQYHTPEECTEVGIEERKKPMLFWKVGPGEFKINDNWSEENRDYVIKLAKEFKDYCKSLHTFITFHQSFSYEDFIEGIKPVFQNAALTYEIKDGAFLEMVKQAENPKKKKMNHVIFIDEINRGNISNIFGELITLIEKDKRASMTNEISVKLAYSRNEFSIPSNLYIIATMNTADRSIEAIDSALRRRFDFIEVAPNTEEIKNHVIDKDVDLKEILNTINERLLILVGKDKLIGHSYFMNINSVEELVRAFKNKIIPLLEEYFYNDRQKILMVLGSKFVTKKEWKTEGLKFFDSTDDLEDVITYEFTDSSSWDSNSFRSIYEDDNKKNVDVNSGNKQDNIVDDKK